VKNAYEPAVVSTEGERETKNSRSFNV